MLYGLLTFILKIRYWCLRITPHLLSMHNKLCVVIPAYNEALSLKSTVAYVREYTKDATIMVINDGSQDDTELVARREGVTLLSVPFNLGIGGAVQTGLKYAYENGFDVAVQVDADGQHNPKYIKKLVNAIQTGADLAIGSRYLTKTSYKGSIIRRLGIYIFSELIRLVAGHRIYDSTSGFRAFNRRSIEFLSQYYPIDFPEPESIVLLLKHGFRIVEVPVEMKERRAGKSSVTAFKSLYFMLSISLSILIEALKPRKFYE